MQITTLKSQFLSHRKQSLLYPGEHIPLLEVTNNTQLGIQTALRFIEWIIANPTGVIALPTGNTPKPFIAQLKRYKQHWQTREVQDELLAFGITADRFPDTSQLKFVQLDEYYPIEPTNPQSFTHYIKTNYLPLLELKPENILLFEQLKHHKVNELCNLYEQQIADWGGIGFFLGGIGPDGHIAFNMPGASLKSSTRLVTFNYPTAAAAAWHLGGIEFARNKTAITVGLKTITQRADATIIIIAAGHNKARVVGNAIEKETATNYPATAFHTLGNAQFIVTQNAATALARHQTDNDSPQQIIDKLTAGLQPITNQRILHTEPHHDDIMLGYHPLAVSLLTNNTNYFVSATSGYNAVTNSFMLTMITKVLSNQLLYEHDILTTSYTTLLQQLKAAYQAQNEQLIDNINTLIFAHKAAQCFSAHTIDQLNSTLRTAEKQLLETVQNAIAMPSELKKLKGLMREAEADRLWTLYDVPLEQIIHMHAQFYHHKTNDYSADAHTFHRYLDAINPDIITLTFDPVAMSPDTHYHVLQMIAHALQTKSNLNPNLRIWGYRNVWYRFSIEEATHMIPVSKQELTTLDRDFCTCFATQKHAAFPTTEFDGPFSQLAVAIAQEQLKNVHDNVGTDYFAHHADPRMQGAAGLLFLKEMSVDEFLCETRLLENMIE